METDKNNQPALVKVAFNLKADQWHGYSVETVWAERMSDCEYKIQNTPFYMKGVSYEDVVSVSSDHQQLTYESTIKQSGRSTYRILIENNQEKVICFRHHWSPLQELGCTYESANLDNMILFAVDVPCSANIQLVYEFLEKGESTACWTFEEGHCAHI